MDSELANNLLSRVNWFDIIDFRNNNFESCINNFYLILNTIIDQTVPKFYYKNCNYPEWFSKDLIRYINSKKKTHSLRKKSKNYLIYIEFKRLRAICKYLSNTCHYNFTIKVENSISHNIKFFWKQSNKTNSNNIPNTLYLNNETSQYNISSANLFAKFFSKVFNPTNYPPLTCNLPFKESLIKEFNVTVDLLNQASKKLTNSNSFGPDYIPETFIKSCYIII